MRHFILAAFATLSLITVIAPVAQAASSVTDNVQATRMQQTGSYSQ